jgi:hypothetical protein
MKEEERENRKKVEWEVGRDTAFRGETKNRRF